MGSRRTLIAVVLTFLVGCGSTSTPASGELPDADHSSLSCQKGREARDGFCQPSATVDCAASPELCGPECPEDYGRVGDAPCLATCRELTDCPGNSHCEDDELPARCACDVGYAGSGCKSCAEGFTPDGDGHCAPPPPGRASLLAAAALGNTNALVAFDPDTGGVTPLRTLLKSRVLSAIDQIAVDAQTDTVYVTHGPGPFGVGHSIARFDLTTGAFSPIAKSDWSGLGNAPLAFDPDGRRLVSVDSSEPYPLVFIDPATGRIQRGGATGVSWPKNVTPEPATGRMLVLRNQGGFNSLHRVNTQTGAAEEVSFRSFSNLLTSYGAMAFHPARERLYMSRVGFGLDLGLWCQRVARRLGYSAQAEATPTAEYVTGKGIGPGTSKVLASTSSGAELIAFGHLSTDLAAAPAEVVVNVQNPQAGICLWNREATRLRVAAGSQFAFLAVYSEIDEESAFNDSLEVESGFVTLSGPNIHVAPARSNRKALDPSWGAHPQAARLYSVKAWADRRLPGSPNSLDLFTTGSALDEFDSSFRYLRTIPLSVPLWHSLAPASR